MSTRGKTTPDSTAGSFRPAAGQRSRAAVENTADRQDMIELWAEAGLMPAGETPWPDDGWEDAPAWVADRYDAWGRTPKGELVVVKADPGDRDETYAAVTTESGVIIAEMRFPTADGELSDHIAAAHLGVLKAWLLQPAD